MLIIVPILSLLAAVPLFLLFLVVALIFRSTGKRAEGSIQLLIGLTPAALLALYDIVSSSKHPLCWPDFNMELSRVPCTVAEALVQDFYSVFLIQVIPLALAGIGASLLAFLLMRVFSRS